MPALLPPIEKHQAPRTLIDALLAQERAWTAVDQFSNWHDLEMSVFRAPSYQRLIPLTQPKPGQQYAFEVDLDKCSGCKACVAACHSLNGLDETETWRSVGLLVGPPSVQQHVTTACHHCVDPGCLSGCPVLAYDKDPVTGIVRHLDDQCIGCQYCIMKCPYEVPQYSTRLGIVRKCDMCYNRLAVGEAPACAQACPSEAIRIAIVDQADVGTGFTTSSGPTHTNCAAHDTARHAERQLAGAAPNGRANGFLPDSPNPALTLPTTRFLSSNVSLAGLKAADHASLRLEKPHWPLILMLVFSQAAAGLSVALSFLGAAKVDLLPWFATVVTLLVVGLAAATLHLGRPLKAWRAFLGWRTSWLSRELIALNAFIAAAILALWLSANPSWRELTTRGVALLGLLAVFTSAMVYIDTGRAAWSARISFGNFFGATALLGAILAAAILSVTSETELAVPFTGAAFALRAAFFVLRGLEQHAALNRVQSSLHMNARVVRERLTWTGPVGAFLFIIASMFCVLALNNLGGLRPLWTVLVALLTFGEEVIARYIFFVASASKRMPGGVFA